MKKVVLAATALALCSLSFAQLPDALKVTGHAAPQSQAETALSKKIALQAVPRSPLSATDCSFTFTSGADNTFLHYCVTANGNVVEFETPQGHTLATLSRNEGYGICDATPNVGVEYHDYANDGDTGNWAPATVVSQSGKSVKIARTTGDGVWTLTQTISQVAGTSPSAKIVMTLKNNSTVDRIAFLVRYMDVDADNSRSNNFDATRNSAEGWNSEFQTGPFGLVLQNVGTSPFSYTGFVQSTFHGPDPCDPGKTLAAGPVTAIDSAVVMFYGMGVPKGKSATVTVAYKGF